ncbi:MAG TPA: BamA/TamA family outer membrane protein [Acidiferrobacterales bacterium]
MVLSVALLPSAGLAEAPATPAPPSAAPAGVIRDIRFVGNNTTRPQIFLQEMKIRVGDPVDPDKIERSRQAIMDLGLYKSVEARLIPEADGSVLEIAVKEKYFILPIPKADYNEDTHRVAFGAQLRLDNLRGLNQQLKLTYEPDSADNPDLETTTSRLEYVYPRVRGSQVDLDMNLARTVTPVEADVNGVPSTYETQGSYAHLMVSRWFARESPTIGWLVGTGLVWQKQVVDVYQGERPEIREATGVGVLLRIQRSEVRDLLFSRSGREYGYTGEYGAPFLGSDSDYVRHVIFYRSYMPVLDRPHRSVHVQLQLGMATEPVFGSPAFTLGGARSLRGYPRASVMGNAFVLANVEYLTPLFDRNELRGVLFADIGNAYPSNSELDFSGLKSSIGVGMRWKLKSFVNIDLRIDCGYALNAGSDRNYECHAGTRESF